ncbi:acyltransferase family protein [Micromonospora deserti]|uniref:Acyltransferase n=1 Tax=Micromonospora deserti TaxID=2070366 RepID=A0A2W2C2I2_9ACTN|nr:acyltransferase [Micromonospora deserti]PZF92050.1 acyltransferase [Micromonospora deserti]
MTAINEAATPARESLPTRLPSLTALRIIAASLVFVGHGLIHPIFRDDDANKVYAFLAHNTGSVGVSFFFVLSGFVLTWSARSADTTGAFLRRRFFKIFPNHVVVYLAVLALMVIAGLPVMLGPTLASLPLIQGFLPDPAYHLFAVNGPTWSLSVELLFYALFPVLLPLVNRIRPQRLWVAAGLVVAGAMLLPVIAKALLPDQPPSLLSSTLSWPEQWFVYFFPPARLFEFLAGMVMARILLSGRWIGVRTTLPAVLLVAVYAATLPLSLMDGYQSLLLVPMILLITAAAANDVAGRRSLLSNRPMVWLGEISYAFFLVHVHVLFLLHAAVNGQLGVRAMYQPYQFDLVTGIAFLIGVYLVCVLVSWLLYALVERPAMRRWARSRPAVAPAVPH